MDGQCGDLALTTTVLDRWNDWQGPSFKPCAYGNDASVMAPSGLLCCAGRYQAAAQSTMQAFAPSQLSSCSWWADVLHEVNNGLPTRTAHFVEVWFLHFPAYPKCLHPRRIRINRQWTEEQLRYQLMQLWIDVIDHSLPCVFHRVTPRPTIRRATVAQIVMKQDGQGDSGTALLHDTSRILSFSYRAVIIRPLDRVWQVARRAELDVCESQNFVCTMAVAGQADMTSWQPVPCWHGALCELSRTPVDEPEEPIDNSTDTTAATSESLEDDETATDIRSDFDIVSLVASDSSTPVQSPSSPIIHGLDDLPQKQMLHPPDVVWDNWPQVRDLFQEVTREIRDADVPWTAVTYGVALTDLGRRDVQFLPRDVESLDEMIHRLWEDHATYGTLQLALVDPKPEIAVRTPHIVVLVVVDMPAVYTSGPHPGILVIEKAAEPHLAFPRPRTHRLAQHVSRAEEFHIALQRMRSLGVRDTTGICLECQWHFAYQQTTRSSSGLGTAGRTHDSGLGGGSVCAMAFHGSAARNCLCLCCPKSSSRPTSRDDSHDCQLLSHASGCASAFPTRTGGPPGHLCP